MEDLNATTSGDDVYSLLELCTSEELAPIVEALAAAPVSFLRFTRAFERHQPDHVRYTDQIGDEIYRLARLAQGRSDAGRPSYSEMVAALCKQIGFSANAGGPNGGEALLLNAFAKRHLSAAPATDRPAIVTEAAAAAASAVSGVFSSDAWPPLASALVHVAYLRSRLGEDGRWQASSRAPALLPPAEPTAVHSDAAQFLSMRMQGDELMLVPVADPPRNGWCDLGGSTKLSGALDPILKGIQPLIAASQTLRTDELLRRLPEGVKGTMHIVEKGTQGMGGLSTVAASSLLGPMAIMMLAGALAEQRKLEAIERSLAEIKTAIADVSRFQQEERRSVLKGSIRYFQQVAPSVLTVERPSEVLQEIERHEVDLVRVQEHLTEELRDRIAALRTIRKETFGSGKFVKALAEAQASLDAKYDELLLCLQARACGYQLLCAFPGRDGGKAARLADITSAIDAISPSGEATMTMDAVLREKIAASSSIDAKSIILGSENLLLDRIATARNGIFEGLRSAGPHLPDAGESIAVDFRLENGRPVAMRLA